MYLIRSNETFSIGDEIVCVESAFKGMVGTITDIKDGEEKETENPGTDIYCDLILPVTEEIAEDIRHRLVLLYGYPYEYTDSVIMAPEMIRHLVLHEVYVDELANGTVKVWDYWNGEEYLYAKYLSNNSSSKEEDLFAKQLNDRSSEAHVDGSLDK